MSDDTKEPNINSDEAFDIEAGGEEVAALKAQIESLKKDYLYLRADFDNYRKAKVKEISEMAKYGSRRLAAELLNVIDTFERGLQMEITSDKLPAFVEGMRLTANELQKVFNDFGIKELDVLNKAFDPNTQEALTSEASEQIPAGHVLRVFKKGYLIHDQLLRPAQVVVAKAVTSENTEK